MKTSVWRLRALLAVLLTCVGAGVVLASPASAKTALFAGGADINYKGCRIRAQAPDYGMGGHPGFAKLIWVKVSNDAVPSGCTWEMWIDYQYWNGRGVSSTHDFFGNMQAAGRQYLDSISKGSAGVRVTGGTITLCRSYWDDCKSYSAQVLE